MADRDKIDKWRSVREQVADQCFKLGSVFFWPQEKHFFLFLGPADDDATNSFFISGSSQPYWDNERNFPIVPEDFRTAKQETKSRAFVKTTYFLFSKFLNHRYETAKLREQYLNGSLEYKFNLKTDLPDAFDRLEDFINKRVPPAYAERFLGKTNVPPEGERL
jgi:hypothetical protein